MTIGVPAVRQFAVHTDFSTIHRLLKLVRRSARLKPLNLFGRRSAARSLDYLERRSSERSTAQFAIYYTQVDFDGCAVFAEPAAESHLAFSNDVSLRGIGFSHNRQIDGNYLLVSFQVIGNEFISILLELRWQNLNGNRQAYHSGGRFVGLAESLGA